MKIKITAILLFGFQSVFGQGIKFDKEKYENIPVYEPQKSQGFANATLPSKISYRDYCPPVLSQGQLSNQTWIGREINSNF